MRKDLLNGANPPSVTNLVPMPESLSFPGGLVLAHEAKEKMTPYQRGSGPYVCAQFALDWSGSLSGYFRDIKEAITPYEATLADNPLARESIFCLTYQWAEDVVLIGAEPGALVVPETPPNLPGTNFPRLLAALRHDALKFADHCKGQRVRHFDSLWLILSDFQNCTPFAAGELEKHIQFIEKNNITVVSAMVGNFDQEVAGMVSNTPPVPANLVPLADLFSILGRSLSSSVSRPGSLKDIATAAITRKLRGAKQ